MFDRACTCSARIPPAAFRSLLCERPVYLHIAMSMHGLHRLWLMTTVLNTLIGSGVLIFVLLVDTLSLVGLPLDRFHDWNATAAV